MERLDLEALRNLMNETKELLSLCSLACTGLWGFDTLQRDEAVSLIAAFERILSNLEVLEYNLITRYIKIDTDDFSVWKDYDNR